MSMPADHESETATAEAVLVLTATLRQRLERLAMQRGLGVETLGQELLLQALSQGEAEELSAGRCSTRMGQCSVGPVPLPLQQP
jgi:hypothetical protein